MEDWLRLAAGVTANATSMLLYAAPVLTFWRVIKKKSTEKFSCVPYIAALLNCSINTWYGLPVVSYKWENFSLVTINGLGVVLEISFILTYLWFAPPKGKKQVAIITIPIVLMFCVAALVSAFVFHDRHHRKVIIGSIGIIASAAMYGSPLVVVKQVIETKSVEFMPFHLSFFSFLTSSLWLAYGLLSRDLLIAFPSFVGAPLGMLQILVYCKYRRGIMEEPQKWDIKQNDEKAKQQLQLTACAADNAAATSGKS